MTKSEQSRAIPVRFSNLKQFAKSPAHYFQSITTEREDSRAMRIGRAVHALVLGGEYDRFDGNTRTAKGYAEFERNAKSDTVLTNPEYFEALRIATAVQNDSEAVQALSGTREMLLETAIGKRSVRGTPDAFNPVDPVLTDLKTAKSADPVEFSRQAINMNYIGQLAWYRMLIRMVYNVDIRTFRLVAVETTAPYCVTVLNVPLDMIEEADKVNRTWFERLIECEAADSFPGYTGGKVIELVKPRAKTDYSILTNELDESEAA